MSQGTPIGLPLYFHTRFNVKSAIALKLGFPAGPVLCRSFVRVAELISTGRRVTAEREQRSVALEARERPALRGGHVPDRRLFRAACSSPLCAFKACKILCLSKPISVNRITAWSPPPPPAVAAEYGGGAAE